MCSSDLTKWSDDWAGNADRSLDSRGGMVERVTATRGIETAPIGKILDEARNKTESGHGELRDFRPFEGLVVAQPFRDLARSEEHTSEPQSLMSILYAVFSLKKKTSTGR